MISTTFAIWYMWSYISFTHAVSLQRQVHHFHSPSNMLSINWLRLLNPRSKTQRSKFLKAPSSTCGIRQRGRKETPAGWAKTVQKQRQAKHVNQNANKLMFAIFILASWWLTSSSQRSSQSGSCRDSGRFVILWWFRETSKPEQVWKEGPQVQQLQFHPSHSVTSWKRTQMQ